MANIIIGIDNNWSYCGNCVKCIRQDDGVPKCQIFNKLLYGENEKIERCIECKLAEEKFDELENK